MRKIFILALCMSFFNMSCDLNNDSYEEEKGYKELKQELEEIKLMTEEEVVNEEEVIIVTEQEEVEEGQASENVEVEEEVIIEEEIVVEPITEYDNYLTLGSAYNGRVYGVDNGELVEIEGIKDLFKIDNVIYFTKDNVVYSQENNVVTEIEESDIPTIPESVHIVFEESNFKIIKFDYKGTMTSRITLNDASIQPYLCVDSAILLGDKLLFSVVGKLNVRKEGVFLWTKGDNYPKHIYEQGKIW